MNFLEQLQEEGILKEDPDTVIQRLTITDDYSLFADHEVVIESIIENPDDKKRYFNNWKMFYLPPLLLVVILQQYQLLFYKAV